MKLILVAFVSLLTLSSASAVVLADSISDFRGSGDLKNWSYGYWNRGSYNQSQDPSYDPNTEFSPMHYTPLTSTGPNATGPAWVANDVDSTTTGFFTKIWADGSHPNGNNDYVGRTRARAQHWAIRRWTSTFAGVIKVTTRASMLDSRGSGTEQGVIYRLVVNGVYRPEFINLNGGSTAEQLVTHVFSVHVGDRLDFSLDPKGENDSFDSTRLHHVVEAVPEPSSTVALGCGALVLISRRKASRLTK